MKQFRSQILENPVVAKDYREMFLRWPEGVRVPAPGQILSVRVNSSTVPFLRRPFAIASFDKETRIASIIYHVRGPGTALMAALIPGDEVDILGPRGFYFRTGTQRKPLLVGGGVGTGPIVYAANLLASKGYQPVLVLGYRNRELVPTLRLDPAVRLLVCTDDGTTGLHGTVIDGLDSLGEADREDGFVWACGPQPMLRAVHFWAAPKNLPCQVSLEEIMACGVGACMGCTVETTDERQVVRVCTEGPVLPSEVVKWT